MDNQLDPQALALAKAIRRTETGGHKDPYNARGASGEFGAFQFMPATYKSLAQKHLGNPNAAPTVENQNKIVYSEIKKLKDQGYNPAQIASIWNSGKPDRYKNGGVGVNKYGVAYNVPQYVSKVSQNYKALIGTVQPVQQKPVEPVEPTIEQQKQERIAQGLPVSVREDRAEPTMVGNIIRGIAKPFVSAATTVLPAARSIVDTLDGGGQKPMEEIYRPVKTGYLGDVYSPGAKGIMQLDKSKNVGDVLEGATRATADIAGKGIEIGSYGIGGTAVAGLKTVPAIKQAAIEGAKIGAVGGLGVGLQEGAEAETLPQALGNVAQSTAIGGLAGGVLGGATAGIGRGIEKVATRNNPEVISSKIDNEIKDIFKGTTGDIEKINTSAYKARKGIELLNKEADNIKIPNENAPLGSRETKSFNPATAKPNELLSGVKEMDNLIVNKMKKATEDARARGFEVNTNDAKLIIQDSIDNGLVPKASGERMLKQVDSIGNDPVKAHDWVQEVNMKYKKKYERGTIDDTAIGGLADDVAQVLRENLDLIVDRKGYAEAYGNNQELKRLLVGIAKKANKQVNWGDITTDAGLDAAISLLTGNPAYMARTVASSLFRSIWSKFRNNQGLRSFRRAVTGTAKLPTETRLPYSVAKPQKLPPLLSEGKGFENKAGIQLKAPKQPTTFEPRAKVVNTQPRPKQLGLPAPKNVIELPKNVTKSTLGSDVTENAVIRNPNDRRKLLQKPIKPVKRIISEESYKKALKNLGDTSTLNSTPIHLSKDALIVAGYHIENGVRSAVELGERLAKEGYKFTKEQLEELFNKAQNSLKSNDLSTSIQKAKASGQSFDEWVKGQGEVAYRGEGGTNVAQGKALLAEGKHFASDAEYPKGFGKVEEYVLKPNAKVLDLGDSTFAEISQKLGIPERRYISPKELSTIAKEKGYDVVKYAGEYKSTGKQFSHTVDLTGNSFKTRAQLKAEWDKVVKPTKRIISEESYRKALKNLGDTSTLNSTPIHLGKDALIVAGYHIENGVRSAAELGIELAKKGYKFTKEQLDELWNKAQSINETKSSPLQKATSTLEQEAKKYNSPEEFYNAKGLSDDFRSVGIKGRERFTKFWEDSTGKSAEKSYTMSHRPSELGSGHNISEKGGIPEDVYEHPEWYFNMSDKNYQESFNALKKIRNKPEAEVTIYRAAPKNELNNGDWITLSKGYAKQESLTEGTPVHSFKVKAKDIQFAGDDLNEFGYFPKNKSQLTDISNKANKSPLPKATSTLEQEAKKYKSAEDFINGLEYTKSFTTGKYGKSYLSQTEIGSWSIKNIIDKKMNNYSGDVGRKLFEKSKLKNLDSYTIQEFLESNKILGGLNGDMKNGYMVYRVVPEDGNINPGDFVFTNMKSAEDFLKNYGKKRNQIKIVSIIAKPDELILPVPEDVLLKQVQRLRPYNIARVDEFIYAPKSIQGITEQKLEEIWKKANKSPLPKTKEEKRGLPKRK